MSLSLRRALCSSRLVLALDLSHSPGVIVGLAISRDLLKILLVVLQGTAHCANMESTSPNDPPQLTMARAIVSSQVKAWIAEV